MSKTFIVGMARTALGSFQGGLGSLPAPRLGAVAIQGALQRSKVASDLVSEVIMGEVLSAGVGQAPARQASIYAGIPDSVPCLTVNKVCGSGMQAMILGSQSIALGESTVVVAGGMESMTQAPYLLSNARSGLRMGNAPFVDSMIHDGLWDPYSQKHMGTCGDLCASEKGFSRKDQDDFAAESFRRAQAAQKNGSFKNEIVPVMVKDRKGLETPFDQDEGPAKVQFDKIPNLKPAFGKDGTVTAANASTVNDGAAAVILAGEDAVRSHGLKPIARLVSYGRNAQKPEWFTTAPAEAMNRALKKAGWKPADVDLWEVNEAFAVVAMAAQRELSIPADKLNVFGGAISLGHPLGASGCRIVVTLINALQQKGANRGCAGICIGGGEALAVCVELV